MRVREQVKNILHPVHRRIAIRGTVARRRNGIRAPSYGMERQPDAACITRLSQGGTEAVGRQFCWRQMRKNRLRIRTGSRFSVKPARTKV